MRWKHSGLTSKIETATRAELAAGGYPEDGIHLMMVSFTSEEDIQRKTGHWRRWFIGNRRFTPAVNV